ncbi:hypothetical protein VE04_00865 [Pseudogymnoascus sp. 24MN13]|nr:hypothetical protein VE04_00865 [Pseudogymnoascus sp. 24MN13]
MTSQPVHPLRIQKSTPNTSPVKMGSSIPRALTELAPTERRQNSPSYNQGSPKETENGYQYGFVSIPIFPLQCVRGELVATTILARIVNPSDSQ